MCLALTSQILRWGTFIHSFIQHLILRLICHILFWPLLRQSRVLQSRLGLWGILCGLSSLCLGRGHPEKDGILQWQIGLSGNFQANTYPLLEASESWSWDCVSYLYSVDYLHIHFLTEDLKLQFNKMKPVGEESRNTHLDTRRKIALERPTKNWEALAIPKGGDPMVRTQRHQEGMKTLVFYE